VLCTSFRSKSFAWLVTVVWAMKMEAGSASQMLATQSTAIYCRQGQRMITVEIVIQLQPSSYKTQPIMTVCDAPWTAINSPLEQQHTLPYLYVLLSTD
jgi:hypothetical protein